jgi:GTPase SAR1 family protein
MNFTLWDVSGQATRLWKHYFDKIHAVVFVIDSTDNERLTKAKVLWNWVDEVQGAALRQPCGVETLTAQQKYDIPDQGMTRKNTQRNSRFYVVRMTNNFKNR